MWSVALELYLISHIPFWETYLTVAAGELAVSVLGAVIIKLVSSRVDFKK